MTFDIWREGFCFNEESEKADCFARNVEGKDFKDAVEKWYNSLANPKDYGELVLRPDGSMSIFGCRLFDNEEEARKSFG